MQPTLTNAAPSPQARGKDVPAPVMVPFTRAAYRHEESFLDTTLTPTSSSQAIAGGFIDVPSYGYARMLMVNVKASGGTGAAAVYQEDAPWSVLERLELADVNGAPIYGPVSGYSAFIEAMCGGHLGPGTMSYPTSSQTYFTPTTAGNFDVTFFIPLELSVRDGVGSLPNMNAAQAYKLRLTLAPLASIYSTNPTGLPSIRVRAQLLAYSQPNPTGAAGAPLAQQPPALGTTQFVTETTFPIGGSGSQELQLPRRGNLIRHLAVLWRDNTGARSNSFPDPIALYKDGALVKSLPYWRAKNTLAEQYGMTTVLGNITGLFVFPFHSDFSGAVGQELRDGWLPTLQSTRLTLQGSFGTAGQLTVITNDVAPDGDVYNT